MTQPAAWPFLFFLWVLVALQPRSTAAQTLSVAATYNLQTTADNIEPRGIAISPDKSKAIVAEWQRSRVRIINLSNGALSEVATGTAPLDVVIAPDGQYAYVLCFNANAISRVDITNGSSTTDFVTGIATTGNVREIELTPDGKTAIVSTAPQWSDADNQLVFIDLQNASILGRVTIPNGSLRMAVHPDGSSVFTSGLSTSGIITEVNIATRTVVNSLTTGSSNGMVKGFALGKGGSLLYCIHTNGHIAEWTDIRGTGTQVWSAQLTAANLNVEYYPGFYAIDTLESRLYLVTMNTTGASDRLHAIDLNTRSLLYNNSTGGSSWPACMAISKDASMLMVSNWRGNSAGRWMVANFAGGTGTSSDPYRISNWWQLNKMRYYPNSYFRLSNNLNNSSSFYANYAANTANNGSGWVPVGNSSTPFSGSFNGADFSIASLYINRPGEQNVGLFGMARPLQIQRLTLTGVNITGGANTGALAGRIGDDSDTSGTHSILRVQVTDGSVSNPAAQTGGLIGLAQNAVVDSCSNNAVISGVDITGGLIGAVKVHPTYASIAGIVKNSKSSNQVSGGAGSIVGGLIGQLYGKIENCSATGSVEAQSKAGGLVGSVEPGGAVQKSFAKGSVTAPIISGGLVAFNFGAISNCYAIGSVEGSYVSAGGLVAVNDYYSGTITNCYSTGVVTGFDNVGGLIGQNAMPGSIFGDPAPQPVTSSYWDMESSGKQNSDGGSGQNTVAMKTQATFAGWDFTPGTGIWAIQTAATSGGYVSYPYLQSMSYDQPGSTGGTNAMPGLSQVEIIWNGTQSNSSTLGNNWNIGAVPSAGLNIKFSPTASNDMILNQSMQLGNIDFNGSNKKIVIGNNNLTTTGFSNCGEGNFVQTNGTGFLKMNLPGLLPPTGGELPPGAPTSQPVLFPVGNSSYCPVTITNNTGADDVFGLRVEDEVYKNGSSGASIVENHVMHTWHISKNNPNGGSGVNFLFSWNSDDVAYGSLATPSLYHHNGTNWEKQTGSSSSTASSFTYTGYTGSFSPFAIAEGATLLAVRNLQFAAARKGNDVSLTWSTQSENNSKDFVLEHSLNGAVWTTLATVEAAGNSSSPRLYQYLHTQPASGDHYYRLLQRDLNGQQVYSPVARITIAGGKNLDIYPNPAKAGANLQFYISQLPAGNYSVQLIGSNGQTYLQMRLQHQSENALHSLTLPASLPAGIYRLQLPGTSLPVKTIMIQ